MDYTALAIAIVILLGWIYLIQERLIYVPSRFYSDSFSSDYFLSDYNMGLGYNHYWVTEDNKLLHGLLMLQPQDKRDDAPFVLFCHGNAGNLTSSVEYYSMLYHKCGCNIFTFDYRGYGNSGNIFPSELGLKKDAFSALHYLYNLEIPDSKKKKHEKRIYIYGHSLGGAVAIYLASMFRGDIEGIVLENTFTSIPDVAVYHLNYIYLNYIPFVQRIILWILEHFLKSQWQSKQFLRSVDLPILFLSGGKDSVVPPSQMLELSRIAKYSSFHYEADGDHCMGEKLSSAGVTALLDFFNSTHSHLCRFTQTNYYELLMSDSPPRTPYIDDDDVYEEGEEKYPEEEEEEADEREEEERNELSEETDDDNNDDDDNDDDHSKYEQIRKIVRENIENIIENALLRINTRFFFCTKEKCVDS
jgi:abhydrolase domain-containing protein 13